MPEGGCACGAVRFTTEGEPKRIGLCHCLTCRKRHGSAFDPFVVFAATQVTLEGALLAWRSSDHATRHGCMVCGSPIAMTEDDSEEIELNLGSFDDTSQFTPLYENWVGRRETWLRAIDGPQNAGNRPV